MSHERRRCDFKSVLLDSESKVLHCSGEFDRNSCPVGEIHNGSTARAVPSSCGAQLLFWMSKVPEKCSEFSRIPQLPRDRTVIILESKLRSAAS